MIGPVQTTRPGRVGRTDRVGAGWYRWLPEAARCRWPPGPTRHPRPRSVPAMSYVSLYRKWRPQTFADVIGQEHVTGTLVNALTTGQVHHAMLFTGTRGTGKTSTARILAKALNCERGITAEPDNTCASCRAITDGTSLDVVEIDAASHGSVDDARDLREKAGYAPAASRFKVYIIDEAHMVTTQGFNAMLKVLEEPPDHVRFIFATTEPHKVIEAIRSRCQRHDFRRVKTGQLA